MRDFAARQREAFRKLKISSLGRQSSVSWWVMSVLGHLHSNRLGVVLLLKFGRSLTYNITLAIRGMEPSYVVSRRYPPD